jgi:hypothetical protein
MNPTEAGFTEISKSLRVDDRGTVFYKNEDGTWNNLEEIDMRIERFTEENVMKAFPDSLLNDGDTIYVRRIGGRLQWLKANTRGSDKKWVELTPTTAKHLEVVGEHPETLALPTEAESLEELRKKLLAENVESHKIGWYQDTGGNLYQFNGSEWVGTVPNKKLIADLEYLG